MRKKLGKTKKIFKFIQYCNSKIVMTNNASWHMIYNLHIVEHKKEAIL